MSIYQGKLKKNFLETLIIYNSEVQEIFFVWKICSFVEALVSYGPFDLCMGTLHSIGMFILKVPFLLQLTKQTLKSLYQMW